MAKDKPQQHACPNCGYCPHCGRSDQPRIVPMIPAPLPMPYPRPFRPWHEGPYCDVIPPNPEVGYCDQESQMFKGAVIYC